jgi:hypothetical protein
VVAGDARSGKFDPRLPAIQRLVDSHPYQVTVIFGVDRYRPAPI